MRQHARRDLQKQAGSGWVGAVGGFEPRGLRFARSLGSNRRAHFSANSTASGASRGECPLNLTGKPPQSGKIRLRFCGSEILNREDETCTLLLKPLNMTLIVRSTLPNQRPELVGVR